MTQFIQSLSPEQQQQYHLLQAKMIATPDTTARIAAEKDIAGKKIKSAEDISGARITSAETIAGNRIISGENIAQTNINAAHQRLQDRLNASRSEAENKMAYDQWRADLEETGRNMRTKRIQEGLAPQRQAATALADVRKNYLEKRNNPGTQEWQLDRQLRILGEMQGAERTDYAKKNIAPLWKKMTNEDLQFDSEGDWLWNLLGKLNPLAPIDRGAGSAPAPGVVVNPSNMPKDATQINPQSLSEDELLALPDDVAEGLPADVQARRFLLKTSRGQ